MDKEETKNQTENDGIWEYKVIHININIEKTNIKTDPTIASQKLQGSLSPEFIKREFPEVYQKSSKRSNHPAAQLEQFLNHLGQQGWELVEISQVGGLLMFFFKRPTPIQSAQPSGPSADADKRKISNMKLDSNKSQP